MRWIKRHAIAVVLILGTTGYAVAEEITLTTYYPAPRGMYDELRTTGKLTVGDRDGVEGILMPVADNQALAGQLRFWEPDFPAGTQRFMEFIYDSQNNLLKLESETAPNTMTWSRNPGTEGNVGIGTAAPTRRLELQDAPFTITLGRSGSGAATAALRLMTRPGVPTINPRVEFTNNDGGDEGGVFDVSLHQDGDDALRITGGGLDVRCGGILPGGGLAFRACQQSGSVALLVNNSNGNVGIGTSNPARKLHVADPTNPRILVQDTSNNGNDNAEINLQNHVDSWAMYIEGTANTGDLRFWNDGDRVTFEPNGNVGIKTSAPTGTFHINETLSNAQALRLGGGAGARAIFMVPRLGNAGYNDLSQSGDSGMFFTGGSINSGNLIIGPWSSDPDGLRIRSNGKVGIGMNPDGFAKLQVAGAIEVRTNTSTTNSDTGGAAYYLRHTGGPWLWQWEAKPSGTLEWRAGTGGFFSLPDPKLRLTTGGILSAGGFALLSDAAFKQHVLPLQGALDKVSQLRGVTFEWKDREPLDAGRQHEIGVIAQEVEAVFPEFVITGEDGYKAVEYGRMSAVLIEAIKELRAENETLRQRIEALEDGLHSR